MGSFQPLPGRESSGVSRDTRDKSARPAASQPRNLLNSLYDHDSCGVGFVASSKAEATHHILQQALIGLGRLAHRGAVAADGKSSDGVGIMTAIPRAFLLKAASVILPADEPLGVGVLYLPAGKQNKEYAKQAEEALASCLSSRQIRVLAWRDVPVRLDALGEIAIETMPVLRQVLVTGGDPATIEHRLYLARKQFERLQEDVVAQNEPATYLCSLSSKTIIYKAMCVGRLLGHFYPDLESDDYVTDFAIFHQRYATNTLPTWMRAQPLRMLAHNGEINTIWGNRARMAARDSQLPVECKPILTQGGTDSTSLDEAIELLSQNGRTLPEAIRMLVPPAQTAHESPFLRYHQDCAEPWDGPAALCFSDGRYVGAALDRNGLRPCRFAVTRDGLVVAGSEAGLVDLDANEVEHSGRLGPGQMLVVDMQEQKVYESDELLDLFDNSSVTYAVLAADVPLQELPLSADGIDPKSLLPMQRGFGYTREDVRMVLAPMAADGKDAVWSMGDDAPLAPLAKAPRPVYGYFRQRFAQVTNPAIDPLRESCVVSLHTRIGPWAKLLDNHAPLPGITVESPFLSLGQVEALRQGKYPHEKDLKFCELHCVFTPDETLEQAIDALCMKAIDLTRQGARILLLTDRSASATQIPVPMAMATGAVHEALVEAGLRTLTGLTVEAGDCRDVHHAAVLIGFGAAAVCPWLALETARSLTPAGGDVCVTEHKMLKALDLGLAKIMSKMGISVVSSYRGAHLFDLLGLHQEVADRCFPQTPSPLSGIGFKELESGLRAAWIPDSAEAIVAAQAAELPDFGWIRFRKDDKAESHAWQPPTVKALQTVVGSARNVAATTNPFEAWTTFTRSVTERPVTTLRDLLEIRPAGAELSLDKVEQPKQMMHRFIASAMSLGSLSPEAHQTITAAMNMLGGKSNTGEGGEDPDVYRAEPLVAAAHTTPGTSAAQAAGSSVAVAEAVIAAPAVHTNLNNKIKQVASGRFGVTAEYLAHAEELEIKVAQGAKPGEGGQLPGHKVSELIARLRHAQPGVALISPPPHHDIYSIEDLAQLIYDLKRVNPKAAVGVKLVSGCGVGTVAAGVAKAYADYIVIAGHSGGTGASSLSSIKYAGNPWELGLAEAQQVLMDNGLRGRVRLRTDGGLATARDVLIAALLGADEFAFGTSVLVALGCDMARQCHLNSCPTGIATQKPELRAKFRGKPEHIVTMFEQLAADLQQMLARYGLPSIEAAIGRTDLLEQVRHDGGIDLTPVLAKVGSGPTHCVQDRNERPIDISSGNGLALDEPWVEPVLEAVKAGKPITIESKIENQDRSIGARLAGELALFKTKLGGRPHTHHDVTLKLHGTAGQSFGAFCTEGMTLILDGQANDFVGKGLCGGEILLRACGLAAQDSGNHVILGNVALYGATGGALYAAGRAGERFAVRNSGANAVVEGVGDHGCEYMTGGTVVVMGSAGMNFGAGMTGGTAWILDADGSFLKEKRYHTDFVTPERFWNLTLEEQDRLRALLTEHAQKSLSTLAKSLLAHWPASVQRFLKLTPKPQA